MLGIVNGTTNFILDKMDTSGADFSAALAEAQALGYAEADPTADVAGFDAASKAAILASIAFHTEVTADDVYREGILSVTAADIASAKAMGCVVKLLAICERSNGGISARVHPAMIPRTHPLAAVREAYNAVFVEAESAGRLMFYGAGAGGQPTASAVLGDTVAIARNLLAGLRGPDSSTYAQLPLVPIGDARTSYYVQLDVADRPGVLAPGRRRVRPAGRVDQGGQAGGPRRGREPDHHDARGQGGGAGEDGGGPRRDGGGAERRQRDARRGAGGRVTAAIDQPGRRGGASSPSTPVQPASSLRTFRSSPSARAARHCCRRRCFPN